MVNAEKRLIIALVTRPISFFLILFVLIAGSPGAQSNSPHALIEAVNEMRAGYELAPYEIDNHLMEVAQAHSDYQASIKTLTHNRADGSGPGAHGISSENIASGVASTTLSSIVYSQWSDYWHTHTLIGYSSGRVGAGMAEADGIYYYTLVVVNTGVSTNLPDSSQPTAVQGATTAAEQPSRPSSSIVTVTPREDDAVVHVVQAGQTLWGIANAYGVTVDDLKAINGLYSDNPTIRVGQQIFVRAPSTPTITATPAPPTRTLRPTRTVNPARQTALAAATATDQPTPQPTVDLTSAPPIDIQTLGVFVLLISLAGLGIVLLNSLRGR